MRHTDVSFAEQASCPALILASSSPRRRQLLTLLSVPFEVVTSHVDETVLPGEAPAETARRLSQLKALAVARLHPQATILAADTVVALGGEILGKPSDAAEATWMLRRLRGQQHTVYSGIAVVQGDKLSDEVVETRVWMRAYSDEEIAAYVATGDPLDKAGAYAIQHPHFAPVARLDGCYANVVGLPLCLVRVLLKQAGIEVQPTMVDQCLPPSMCRVPSDIG